MTSGHEHVGIQMPNLPQVFSVHQWQLRVCCPVVACAGSTVGSALAVILLELQQPYLDFEFCCRNRSTLPSTQQASNVAY